MVRSIRRPRFHPLLTNVFLETVVVVMVVEVVVVEVVVVLMLAMLVAVVVFWHFEIGSQTSKPGLRFFMSLKMTFSF